MKTAREIALRTLVAVEQEGAWAGAYLSQAVDREGLSHRDGALALRLCYGVLQNRTLCDFYLAHFCAMPLSKLERPVWNALRLGVYQLLFLDKIPASAAINESVKLAKRYGKHPRAAGLVNAVLRNLHRNRDALPDVPTKDPVKRLSLLYSHPEWLVKEICLTLGEAEAEAFFQANNREAPLAVQANPVQTTAASLLARWEGDENGRTATPHPWLPDCLELQGAGNPARLAGWGEGLFWVQDPAAKLSVLAAAPQAGWQVLDACAAPGGKSFAAAAEMGNAGQITACDIHPRKLQLVAEGASRLGFSCIQTAVQDAGAFREDWAQRFDLVLADLPCSGMGVIRKKPDIRYHPPEPMERLPEVQLRLLSNLSRYVKPGGVLLYSTCTVLRRENQDVVSAFLKGHPAYVPEPFSLPCPQGTAAEGQVTLWPQKQGTDGFFIARLRRKAVL